MYLKKWNIKNIDNKNYELKGFSKIISMILKSRGLTAQKSLDDFINVNGKYKDPFELKDMNKAVNRIKEAIENDEKIIIYGDYDVDGITSTVLMFFYLSSLNANVGYYIPSREKEGYGLNIKSIDKVSKDCQLIITVDNGITAIDEVDYANNLGIDVVVTDHHKPLNVLPNAVAVIDPHRDDCKSGCEYLSGVGVVFKLVSALAGSSEDILDKYSDIICLGTIADVMPLIEENRFIVKAGLKKMRDNPNKGLKALIDISKVDINNITTIMVSYRLAPRINSASRMGQIFLAIRLLLSDSDDEVVEIAKQLDNINNERKTIENEMMKEIDTMILKSPSLTLSNIIVFAKDGWNHSISGINASKLMERYNKPCILISIDGEVANASGRSVEGFSLIKAIDWCKDYLMKYGGHTSAVGFTLKTENIDDFSYAINKYIDDLNIEMPVKSYNVDCEIDINDITVKNINDLKILEPYGFNNEVPTVMIRNATIKNIVSLSGGKFAKIFVEFADGSKLGVLSFSISYNDFIYEYGDVVDIIATLDLNIYNNVVSPMIILKDIRMSNFNQEIFFRDVKEYNRFKSLKEFNRNLIIDNIPSRSEIATVYRYLKRMRWFTYVTVGELIEYLFIKLSKYNLSYIKVGLILEILQDIDVISLTSRIELIAVKQKADIKGSKTYQYLMAINL